MRVLNEAGRDLVVEPDLGEEAQRLRVVSDRARKAQKALIAFERQDPHARQSKQIRNHQADRACADDRHLDLRRQADFFDSFDIPASSRTFGPMPKLPIALFRETTK